MIGGGLWVQMETTLPGTFGPDGPVTDPLILVLRNFSPFAVLTGLQGATGLLFWHAAQWQRKRQGDKQSAVGLP
jgi:hypothetical protein